MTLKRFVNISFLSLSICLSAYFLLFLSKSPTVKVIAVLFAIMYELGNRYIIAAGKTAWKKAKLIKGYIHHYFTALLLFLFYGVYIIYNIISGAGFFITEIAIQDRAAAQAEVVQTANLEKLAQINRSIDTLNRALEVEVETSFRSKSEALEEKIKEREAERDVLLAQLAAAPEGKAEEKNPFRDLAGVLGIPMNWLVGGVWCMVMAGICVILIVTSEELPEEEEKGEPGPEPSKPHSVTKRPVTLRRNSPPVTDVPETEAPENMEEASCACGCGKTFPATPGRLYYDTACRVRDYRRRKREEELQRIKREGVKVF